MQNSTVLISEVGPRDGLQSVKATMPTAHKLAWIDGLYKAGLREMEVCSFVPAKLLPQMADAAEVVRHALTLPGLTVMALVPNLKGAEAALAAGVHKLTIPVSASEAHSLANVRKSRVDMVQEVRSIIALKNERAPHVKVEAGVSTAFGCTIQGEVSDDDVVWIAAELARAGADEVGLSDTTGMANPWWLGLGAFACVIVLGLSCALALYQEWLDPRWSGVWPYIAPLVLWQGAACLSAAFSHRPFQTQSASTYSWACMALGVLQTLVLLAPLGLAQPIQAAEHMAAFAFFSGGGLLAMTLWMARLKSRNI